MRKTPECLDIQQLFTDLCGAASRPSSLPESRETHFSGRKESSWYEHALSSPSPASGRPQASFPLATFAQIDSKMRATW